MEFAAALGSVLKLSAGVQLAPRSSPLGDVLGFPRQLAPEHTAVFIHDRQLAKLVKNLVIPERSFHQTLSKGEGKKKEERTKERKEGRKEGRTPFHAF